MNELILMLIMAFVIFLPIIMLHLKEMKRKRNKFKRYVDNYLSVLYGYIEYKYSLKPFSYDILESSLLLKQYTDYKDLLCKLNDFYIILNKFLYNKNHETLNNNEKRIYENIYHSITKITDLISNKDNLCPLGKIEVLPDGEYSKLNLTTERIGIEKSILLRYKERIPHWVNTFTKVKTAW